MSALNEKLKATLGHNQIKLKKLISHEGHERFEALVSSPKSEQRFVAATPAEVLRLACGITTPGSEGGRSTSPRKVAASKLNGRKGGRPKRAHNSVNVFAAYDL
ncbi:MAG: hypothetical protein KGL39_23175 [Patescibacteria group bacterium]|nr:hypothetical protein [Patescibacteria group bacterium]